MAVITTLADLRPGQSAVVDRVESAMFPALGQRLMQLGIIDDAPVTVVRKAPAGDPLEVKVLDYSLSLRIDEARLVLVRDVR